jgi:hypothetical protein
MMFADHVLGSYGWQTSAGTGPRMLIVFQVLEIFPCFSCRIHLNAKRKLCTGGVFKVTRRCRLQALSSMVRYLTFYFAPFPAAS